MRKPSENISGDRKKKIIVSISLVCLKNNHLQMVNKQTALSGSQFIPPALLEVR
jgi:hypothetical protein